MPPQASLFKKGLAEEARFSRFLDQYVYQPLSEIVTTPKTKIAFERMDNRYLQYQGIDIVLHENERDILIDEKCQLHYLYRDLPTFAFELSYVKDGIVEAGWLLSTRKRNHAFMLCWPFGDMQDGQIEYTGTHMLLVFKHKLLAALSRQGYDLAELSRRDECLRKNGKPGRYDTKNPNVSFYYSTQYAEQMINIVIKSAYLKTLATADLTVSCDKKAQRVHLQGRWVDTTINTTLSVPALAPGV